LCAIAPGLSGELELVVTPTDTAEEWGSGLVPSFSTPSLVGLLEGAAVEALRGHLEPGQTSVGARIDVRHLAPTPVGMRIQARAELLAVDGRKLTFRIEAWDEREQIGSAVHERYIVDLARFSAKAWAKLAPPPATAPG
jgi:fluoroacetyl-CoA thioesterase